MPDRYWICPLQICGVVQKKGGQPRISERQLCERPLHRREEIAVAAQHIAGHILSITVKRTAAVPRNVQHAGMERSERSAGLDEKRGEGGVLPSPACTPLCTAPVGGDAISGMGGIIWPGCWEWGMGR